MGKKDRINNSRNIKIQISLSDGRMQVQVPGDGSTMNVYNFENQKTTKHSHIHYKDENDKESKYINRGIANAAHTFDKPEHPTIVLVKSSDDFDYKYESLSERFISLLSKEQLMMLKQQLNTMNSLNDNVKEKEKHL